LCLSAHPPPPAKKTNPDGVIGGVNWAKVA